MRSLVTNGSLVEFYDGQQPNYSLVQNKGQDPCYSIMIMIFIVYYMSIYLYIELSVYKLITYVKYFHVYMSYVCMLKVPLTGEV